jgi:hypothetical protein
MSRALALLVSFDVALLVLVGIVGRNALSGPLLLTLSDDHGVHLLDLFVLWLALMALAALWLPGRKVRREPSQTGC